MKQADEESGISFQASAPKIFALQQRRARNITTIALRNLTISLHSHHDERSNDIIRSSEALIYFSLHSSRTRAFNRVGDDALLTSEKLPYTNNPTWSNFKILSEDSQPSDLTVRLWIERDGLSLPALQWDLNLPQLVYVGDTLFDDKLIFHSNTVVLGINRWFYTHQTSLASSDHTRPPVLPIADFADTRNSYTVTSCKKILSYQETIIKTNKSLNETRQSIRNHRRKNESTSTLKVEIENLQNKIAQLRGLLKREKLLQVTEERIAERKRSQVKQRETQLALKKDEFLESELKHRESYSAYIATREKIAFSGSQLGNRRKNILSELSQIFPISKVIKLKNENAVDFYSICGAILPDAEHLSSKDDLQTSVALDFTAQLLSMMSQFLLVPLRYPLTHKGAQLMILDHVTEKLSEKERLFPLFVKGNKDRFLFEYGVFLLNKNIAQLRYYFGMGTSDLRLTLRNIHSLLVERLGAKSIFHSTPIMVTGGQHTPLQQASSNTSTNENGSLSVPQILPSLKLPDTPQHKFNKIQTKESSPRKFTQRVEHRNTELSSLRGELFGTGNPQRPPTNVDKGLDFFMPQNDKEVVDFRTDINKDSIESVSSAFKPHRTLTGLEEIGQSKAAKSEPRSAKHKHATARAQLLGKTSTGWGKRSNSSASSDSTRSLTESSRDRGASWVDDVTAEVVPRAGESLPYMSAIGAKGHVNGTRDPLPAEHKGGDASDHVTSVDQSVEEEIDLC